jgi:SSS family solute:Na+ symporter
MAPALILSVIAAYFLLLVVIGHYTSKGADNDSFFVGNRNSPWYVVAFGMIGASLSGVTFISIPGWVATSSFSYMQVVMGYLVGYTVIALVLMPLYYRLNLTSIYGYLEQRFGRVSYRTGAWFFLLSRTIGSAFRLYLVANVLQLAVFDAMGVPFVATVVGHHRPHLALHATRAASAPSSGRTRCRRLFMLVAVVPHRGPASARRWAWGSARCSHQLRLSHAFAQMFFFDDPKPGTFYFWKQFLGGIFIAIVMTGPGSGHDAEEPLAASNIREAQINMVSFSLVLVFVNLAFLALGALALHLRCPYRYGIACPIGRPLSAIGHRRVSACCSGHHLHPWIDRCGLFECRFGLGGPHHIGVCGHPRHPQAAQRDTAAVTQADARGSIGGHGGGHHHLPGGE